MLSETWCRGDFPIGRRIVLLARHNFRSALQIFPRVMIWGHGRLGKIHDNDEWTPIARGDFRWPLVVGCRERGTVLIDE